MKFLSLLLMCMSLSTGITRASSIDSIEAGLRQLASSHFETLNIWTPGGYDDAAAFITQLEDADKNIPKPHDLRPIFNTCRTHMLQQFESFAGDGLAPDCSFSFLTVTAYTLMLQASEARTWQALQQMNPDPNKRLDLIMQKFQELRLKAFILKLAFSPNKTGDIGLLPWDSIPAFIHLGANSSHAMRAWHTAHITTLQSLVPLQGRVLTNAVYPMQDLMQALATQLGATMGDDLCAILHLTADYLVDQVATGLQALSETRRRILVANELSTLEPVQIRDLLCKRLTGNESLADLNDEDLRQNVPTILYGTSRATGQYYKNMDAVKKIEWCLLNDMRDALHTMTVQQMTTLQRVGFMDEQLVPDSLWHNIHQASFAFMFQALTRENPGDVVVPTVPLGPSLLRGLLQQGVRTTREVLSLFHEAAPRHITGFNGADNLCTKLCADLTLLGDHPSAAQAKAIFDKLSTTYMNDPRFAHMPTAEPAVQRSWGFLNLLQNHVLLYLADDGQGYVDILLRQSLRMCLPAMANQMALISDTKTLRQIAQTMSPQIATRMQQQGTFPWGSTPAIMSVFMYIISQPDFTAADIPRALEFIMQRPRDYATLEAALQGFQAFSLPTTPVAIESTQDATVYHSLTEDLFIALLRLQCMPHALAKPLDTTQTEAQQLYNVWKNHPMDPLGTAAIALRNFIAHVDQYAAIRAQQQLILTKLQEKGLDPLDALHFNELLLAMNPAQSQGQINALMTQVSH